MRAEGNQARAALATGAGAQQAPNRCQLIPCRVSAPRPPRLSCPPLLAGGRKFPHLVPATWLLFRRPLKRSRWWKPRGQEEGRGFLPLPPVGRAGRAHGRTGVVGIQSPQGGRWQGMFSVPGGWKSLLFWHKALSGQRAQQQLPAEPMQGNRILCSPFITDIVTPGRRPPVSYPVSLV